MRTLISGCVAILMTLALAPIGPDAAAQVPPSDTVTLVPLEGTTFGFGRFRYGGDVEIRNRFDGLVLVEHVELDEYLAGIREVPFSWPEEALAAQVVAARTYLAWTLDRGRAGAGATYEFDICATTACQVYSGTSQVADGDRWQSAIATTSNQLLIYEGKPAQTLYSSSSGPRTRTSSDVFNGSSKPYLQAVDSDEEGVTPYWEWQVDLPVEALVRILEAAGFAVGADVRSVSVQTADDGGGHWVLEVSSADGLTRIPNADLRWIMNRYGPQLYPGLLPARRDDGRRWPQAILSYTFTADYTVPEQAPFSPRVARWLPASDQPEAGSVSFIGTGWGHGVGMSQWGANAMASDGATHVEILSHYYGGLEPIDGSDRLPDTVAVGLAWGRGEFELDISGSFELRVNGVPAAQLPGGEWLFRAGVDGVRVIPPAGYAGRAVDEVLGRPWPR